MKRIATINDGLSNKISFYHLVLFLAALPFDQFYSQVVFISFLLHTLIHVKKEDLRYLRRREVWILPSVFFLGVVCTLYSNNKPEAYNLWVRQLIILLFPLILSINSIDLKKYADRLLLSFAGVCTAVIIYLFVDALRIIFYNHLPLTSIFSAAFTNHNFSQPIDLHATYLSMYVAVAIAIFYVRLIKQNSRLAKSLFLICLLVLLTGLLQLSSRAVLVSFLVMLNFVFPLALVRKRRLSFFCISFALTIALITFVYNNNNFKNRFVNELKTDLTQNAELHVTDSRMERWNVALELVKNAPIIGYGTAEEKPLLKEKYFQHKLYDAYLNNLNAHNQYISFLLTGGVFALLIFLLTLGYGLKQAIRSGNLVFISFMVLLIVVSLSENFLERNKGIFFYGFFFSFFVFVTTRKTMMTKRPTTSFTLQRQPAPSEIRL